MGEYRQHQQVGPKSSILAIEGFLYDRNNQSSRYPPGAGGRVTPEVFQVERLVGYCIRQSDVALGVPPVASCPASLRFLHWSPTSDIRIQPRQSMDAPFSGGKVAIPRLERPFYDRPSKPRVPIACLKCRKRKVRCSGEQPSCQNCVQQQAECLYPEGRKDRLKRSVSYREQGGIRPG